MAINAGARHPSDVFVSLHGTCFVLVGPSLSALHTRPALRCLCSLLPFGAGGQNAECFPLGSAKCLDWEVPTGTILNEQNFADILQTHNFLDNTAVPPPPPCPSPPLVPPQGGMGDRHLLNPKFFVAAHCVVVAKPPPKKAAQSIPVETGEHEQEFKVKWSRTKKIYPELVKDQVSVHWQPLERILC